ncbi:MAG: acetyl-CoA C-acyltransferase [Sulfitobacter sp.]
MADGNLMNCVILSACRSAVAPRDGAFAALELHEITAPVIRQALSHAEIDPSRVDELILSNAMGGGGNPARVAALAAGLPEHVAGLSIDRQCAGGLDALLLGYQMITSGAADVVVAGGAESYSRRPERRKTFADGRPSEAYDSPPFTPWPHRDPQMPQAAQALAQMLGISRAQQDQWAMQSHAKALAAPSRAGEIVPLAQLERDPFARRLSPKLCARAPVLCEDITAANTAVAADAAAFCVLVSSRVRGGIRLRGGRTMGGAPELPGLAPVAAIEAALKHQGMRPQDLSISEVMEAYAVQALACIEGAGLDPDTANIGGGALARGHPIGASGAINAVRLFHELQAMGGGNGIAAIAAAGGVGTALVMSAD